MKQKILCTIIFFLFFFTGISAIPKSKTAAAKQLFRQGQLLYKRKKYASALILYLKAVHRDPRNWKYLHSTAILYNRHLKQPRKAVTFLRRAAVVEKRSAWSLLELGGIHYKAKRYTKALKIYRQLFAVYSRLQKHPPYWAIHMIASTLAYRLKRPREALPYIRPLLAPDRRNRTRATGWHWMGRIEYCLLKFHKAFQYYGKTAAVLESHLRKKPGDAGARWQLASFYYTALKQIRNSNRHLRVLLARHPRHKNAPTWKRWLVNHSPRIGEVTFTYQAKHGFNQDNFFLLPLDNAQQRHISVRFDPVPLSMRLFRRYGNRWAFLRFRNPSAIRKRKTIRVRVRLRMVPRSIHQGDQFTADRDEDPKRYLDWKRRYDPDYTRRAKLIIGKETDRLRKAWLIHEWISRNFTYKVIGFSTGNEHLYKKLGECGTWSSTSVALMQAAGIPARHLGMHIANQEGGQLGTHIGSEFYHPKYGWIPVDNTGQMFGYIHNRVHPWHSLPHGTHIPHYTPVWASNTIRWLR